MAEYRSVHTRALANSLLRRERRNNRGRIQTSSAGEVRPQNISFVTMSSSSYSRLSQVSLPGIKRLKVENSSPVTKGYNWRDEPFSDFECKLGEKVYKLHRIILATGPHSARYFAAVLNEQHPFKEATFRKGDLTELLPPACWPYFETFWTSCTCRI